MTQKKTTAFDAEISHAMITAVLSGLILTLKKHGVSPWDLTETLSLMQPPTEKDRRGLELAQEWVFRQFTERTPPPEVSTSSSATPCGDDPNQRR